MAIVFAASSLNDFDSTFVTALDDTIGGGFSKPHCNRAITLTGSYTNYLPIPNLPTSGTIMFCMKASTNGMASLGANRGFINVPNFSILRTSGTDNYSVMRRNGTGAISLASLVLPGTTTTPKDWIVQYTPTRLRITVDNIEVFDSGELVITGTDFWMANFRAPDNSSVATRCYLSEITVHDTMEAEFFRMQPFVLSESSKVGFTGDVNNLGLVTNASPMVTDTLGSLLELNLAVPASPLPAGSGSVTHMGFAVRWGSSLAPNKLRIQTTGATPELNEVDTRFGGASVKRIFQGTSTIPTKLKLTVETS